jgi:outer membrane protein assembly factor BamB
MKTRTLLLSAGLLCALAWPAFSADWPQWRGPDRNDVSKETGLLKSWPKAGPKLLWTYKEAGIGFSGPAVVGERLYTLGGDNDKEFVYALDISGTAPRRAWSLEVGPFFSNRNGDGPRATPTVHGDLLYAVGAQGELLCAETATGKKLWRINLRSDLGGKMMSGWGYSESPLVDGDKVVCTPGGPQGTLAALNKKTGEVEWRSKDLTDDAAYSSLVVGNAGGIRQYIVMTGASVSGVAAADGRLLWRYERPSRVAAVPTPIVHDDHVYVSSGYGTGCCLLKLTAGTNGDLQCEKIYANDNMENQHGGVVLVDGHVYGSWGSNVPRPRQKWVCQDFLTGKVAWQVSDKLEKGSVTYADGRLYCYGEQNGAVVLIEASPRGWKEHGRFKVPVDRSQRSFNGRVWTHPVVANGRLYLRDQDFIFCYDVSAANASSARR